MIVTTRTIEILENANHEFRGYLNTDRPYNLPKLRGYILEHRTALELSNPLDYMIIYIQECIALENDVNALDAYITARTILENKTSRGK